MRLLRPPDAEYNAPVSPYFPYRFSFLSSWTQYDIDDLSLQAQKTLDLMDKLWENSKLLDACIRKSDAV